MQKWTNVLKSWIGKQKIYIMSRERQIIDAGIEYTMQNNPICIGGDNFYEASKMHNRNSSFEAGAKWADKHHKLPWISVEEDLPCNHKELIENENYTKKVLVVLAWNDDPSKKHIEICNMCNKIRSFNTNWYWRNIAYYRVVYWKPLPELPKE